MCDALETAVMGIANLKQVWKYFITLLLGKGGEKRKKKTRNSLDPSPVAICYFLISYILIHFVY